MGTTYNTATMRASLIIAAAICIAFVAAETTVEQEDVVPETTLTQNEESFGAVKRHIKRIRFSYCRYKAKKCHKHVAKKTAHLKKAAHAHAKAGHKAAKIAKAHGKAAKAHAKKAAVHAKRAHGHNKVAGHHARIAKYHHKKAGKWWQFWKFMKNKAKAAKATKRAKAHAKAAKSHKNAAKHAAKKAGTHFSISKKLMAYVRAKHKKCGMGFMRCMNSHRRIRRRRRI